MQEGRRIQERAQEAKDAEQRAAEAKVLASRELMAAVMEGNAALAAQKRVAEQVEAEQERRIMAYQRQRDLREQVFQAPPPPACKCSCRARVAIFCPVRSSTGAGACSRRQMRAMCCCSWAGRVSISCHMHEEPPGTGALVMQACCAGEYCWMGKAISRGSRHE